MFLKIFTYIIDQPLDNNILRLYHATALVGQASYFVRPFHGAPHIAGEASILRFCPRHYRSCGHSVQWHGPSTSRAGLPMVPRGGIEPPTRGFSVLCSTDWAIWAFINIYGGEGGIWTLASLLKGSTPLAGEPLQPLEYFSIGGEEGIRTLVSRKTLTVFKTAPLWPLRYLSICNYILLWLNIIL